MAIATREFDYDVNGTTFEGAVAIDDAQVGTRHAAERALHVTRGVQPLRNHGRLSARFRSRKAPDTFPKLA